MDVGPRLIANFLNLKGKRGTKRKLLGLYRRPVNGIRSKAIELRWKGVVSRKLLKIARRGLCLRALNPQSLLKKRGEYFPEKSSTRKSHLWILGQDG